MLQSTHDLPTSKLIILLILENIKKPVSHTQLTEFILYKNYIDYFSLQQYLAELVSSKLIVKEKENSATNYYINEKGIKTLELFANRIPFSIREEISIFTKDENLDIDLFTTLESNIEEIGENIYIVHCFIKEKSRTLINMNMNASSKEEAKKIKMNWLRNARSIYKTVQKELLRK